MSIEILGEIYNVDCKELHLGYKNIEYISDSIGNLINLQKLDLIYNQIKILPNSIGNLINLRELDLKYNKIKILPNEILKIKKVLNIDETSYEINNLNVETEILIFSNLEIELKNLPIGLKEIWINEELKTNIKLPFGCELKRY